MLASVLAMVLFLMLANLVVVQYGRGAIRSALEQGSRAGTIGGEPSCETTARRVVQDLLGGRMSDGLALSCSSDGARITATAEGRFEAWTPFVPDFDVSLSSTAVVEP
ncbi:MAG: hypothetical protein PVF87_06410 [Acidimicrobiia bacterium]